MYDVNELYDDLDGHNKNTIVKIKLRDGSVKEIEGMQYLHEICGGDGIIYIKEVDPIRKKHFKNVQLFVKFCNKVFKECEDYYNNLTALNDPNYDPCHILNVEETLAQACDEWFKWLKLNIKYENGCGSTEELEFKIGVLELWLENKEIPKEVPVF